MSTEKTTDQRAVLHLPSPSAFQTPRMVYLTVMLAYEAFLNGDRLFLAGIDGDGVLNAMLNYGRKNRTKRLYLTVGGVVNATNEEVRWTCPDLKVGDEINVRVIEAVSVDEPTTRQPAPEFNLDAQKAHVRTWIKKLGWTVIEDSAPA